MYIVKVSSAKSWTQFYWYFLFRKTTEKLLKTVKKVCLKACCCFLHVAKISELTFQLFFPPPQFIALVCLPKDPKALFRKCQALDKLDQLEEAYKSARVLIQIVPKVGFLLNVDVLVAALTKCWRYKVCNLSFLKDPAVQQFLRSVSQQLQQKVYDEFKFNVILSSLSHNLV